MSDASGATDRFNPAALEMLLRVGDGTLLGRMADIFLKNVPERLRAAREGVAANDRRAVELASHSLKSSSAQLGGAALQRASHAVEQMAASADPVDPAVMLAGIETMQSEFDMMREWLDQMRTSVAERARSAGGETV